MIISFNVNYENSRRKIKRKASMKKKRKQSYLSEKSKKKRERDIKQTNRKKEIKIIYYHRLTDFNYDF